MAEGMNAAPARGPLERIVAVDEERAGDLANLMAGDLSLERQSPK